ncbi:hypothetical protein TIFTF001_041767 [Ficus carica]|uniref:Uncharacterized protein n=1 Tax=Ficus carica TaxID=3494 RepID=A0AA87Z970_FICCA|nr:hypothetical protein TIFTF001_041764 [Ficus carica]GMN32639.1 hypothetical protein TIFTF001_041767 [Ficus carica]
MLNRQTVEAVEDPNINIDAADAEDVSESDAAAVEGVEDQNFDIDGAGPEEAGVKVERLLVLEADTTLVLSSSRYAGRPATIVCENQAS